MPVDYLKELAIEQLMNSSVGKEIEKAIATYQKIQETLYALVTADDKEALLNIRMDDQQCTEFVFLLYANYINVSAESVRTVASEENVNAINTLADELRALTEQLQEGILSETSYIEKCLWISLEAMLKLLSVTVGSVFIPEINHLMQGLTNYAFEYGRLALYQKEQAILEEYIENQQMLDVELRLKYDAFCEELQEQADKFQALVNQAFQPDFRDSLMGSIELARAAGVKENEILSSVEDIEDFFM